MIAYGLAPHRIPVLRYQRIGDPAKDPLSVSWAGFCDHVRLIATSGRTPLRLTELSELLRRRQIPADPVLAVTIDGGAEETLAAARALAKHDVPVTAFVTPQAIDSPDHLSKAQFDDLVAMGERVEVGAHPGPSPRLDSLPADDSRAVIDESKRRLQEAIGRTVESIAYPGGAYDARVREAVRAAGFRSAATVKNAMSHPDDDPWAIARYTVTAGTELADIEALLDGRGAPLAWPRDRLGTRAGRAARRLGFRLFGQRSRA
jgi:peptidoglycan/xylan/chitin deacetylase (PgdA/CDA1 family)